MDDPTQRAAVWPADHARRAGDPAAGEARDEVPACGGEGERKAERSAGPGPAKTAWSGARAAGPDPPPERPPRSGRRPRAGAGEVDVCPELVKHYLPLVQAVVRQMARRLPANVVRDDLLSAGIMGLVDSLRRNGGAGGESFEGYARMRIRGAVVDELRAQDWLPRRARDALAAGRIDEARALPNVRVSLHELTSIEEATHLAAVSGDPEDAIAVLCQYRALVVAIERLPERERRIVGMHYFDGVKFKDISVELGVSEPRISQLHARALDLLRQMLAA